MNPPKYPARAVPSRAPTEMEQRVEFAIRFYAVTHPMTMGTILGTIEVIDNALGLARACIRAMRDAPHSVLDEARAEKMASGDAALFVNRFIDAASPPEAKK